MADNEMFQGTIKPSYVESEPWWPEKPDLSDKPNILYILLDDTGFADLGCYGSLINTPNIDALAADGLLYNDFHVNSMCSPTRASLLTGCNHHSVGMGYIADLDMGFPNLKGQVSHSCGFISETLREKGYATSCVGKWHLFSPEHATPAGPFDQWPLGRGFEKYYGFLSGETSQYYPVLVNGNEYVQQPALPEDGYHLSEDIACKAISYIGQLKSCKPEKPFFCYVAFGATHAPLQAPKKYVDMYKGEFDKGWDVCRQQIFERQKEMGIIPMDSVLSSNDYLVGDWNSCTNEEKEVLAKYMEVYAGFLSHTDAQIGRIIDYLKRIEQYDNTMIVFMSDNGPSPGGGVWGANNLMFPHHMETDPPIATLEEAEIFGSPDSGIHHPIAWAHVSATPFRMYKKWTYTGGLRVPCIISYPKKIKDKGSVRNQYHHVVDINATVLDILGFTPPKEINGVSQIKKHGISMAYTFDNKNAPRRRHVQYYELMGNRALWCDGWTIVADHTENPTFDFYKDKWELYNTDDDPAQTVNLADKFPDKLNELERLWWYEAGKYDVLPMIESDRKRLKDYFFHSLLRGNPQLKRTHMCYYPEFDMGRGWSIQNHSYTSRVLLNYKKGDEGVLYACGDNLGGYALYIENCKLKMHYNFISYAQFRIESEKELPEGDIELGVNFIKTDDSNGICHLIVNREPVGKGNIHAHPLFSVHGQILSIGRFSAVSVADEYRSKGLWKYTGKIERVEFDLDAPMDSNGLLKRQAQAISND